MTFSSGKEIAKLSRELLIWPKQSVKASWLEPACSAARVALSSSPAQAAINKKPGGWQWTPGMSWGLWLHWYPSARRPGRVDMQVFRSSVPWMMGLFKISRINNNTNEPHGQGGGAPVLPNLYSTTSNPSPICQVTLLLLHIPGHCVSRKKRCLKQLIAGAKGEIIIIPIACSSERAGQTSRDAVEPVSLGSWGMLCAP